MDINQEPKKTIRNSSSSHYNININSGFNQNMNYSNNNIPLINPNYVNCSIYTGNSSNNDMNINMNKINECPNCLSYHQKLKEKNLLIQKLQNQISRLNSSMSSSSSNSNSPFFIESIINCLEVQSPVSIPN